MIIELISMQKYAEEAWGEFNYRDDYDDRQCLKIDFEDGRKPEYFLDGGEPQDNSFNRDWNWIPDMLKIVYKQGKLEGYDEGYYDALMDFDV